MEITDCPRLEFCIHYSLFDKILCINKAHVSQAESIIKDMILLQNVFKLEINIYESCYCDTILISRDNNIEINILTNSTSYVYSIEYSHCKNVDEIIAYLDANFPKLRRENCSKMALK